MAVAAWVCLLRTLLGQRLRFFSGHSEPRKMNCGIGGRWTMLQSQPLSRLIGSYLRLKVFFNGASEIFRSGMIIRRQNRKNPLLLSPVWSRYRRTTPREELARSYHIPVPNHNEICDQLQHRSDSGCPLDPAQSRQVFWSVRQVHGEAPDR
jgi:hypothetical protein